VEGDAMRLEQFIVLSLFGIEKRMTVTCQGWETMSKRDSDVENKKKEEERMIRRDQRGDLSMWPWAAKALRSSDESRRGFETFSTMR